MDVSRVFDGGTFQFNEELTFPNDKDGEKGVVVYEHEHAQEIDEETQWMKTNINRPSLNWEIGAFRPNVSKLDFDKQIYPFRIVTALFFSNSKVLFYVLYNPQPSWWIRLRQNLGPNR